MMLGTRQLATATAAVVVAVVAGGGAEATAGRATESAGGYRIVLGSNRDGYERAYTVRADGSRLTPLLPQSWRLEPLAVSGDGSMVAYARTDRFGSSSGIDVSRADGTAPRRLVTERVDGFALSRDGRLLAYTGRKPGIWIVGTDGRGRRRLTTNGGASLDWSPDGRSLALVRYVGDAVALVVQPLRGTRRVLAWGSSFASPRWSPDGRWIAYSTDSAAIRIVRTNGPGRRLIARMADEYAWSPDSKRLAYGVHYGKDVAVVDVRGRSRRLGLRLGGAEAG